MRPAVALLALAMLLPSALAQGEDRDGLAMAIAGELSGAAIRDGIATLTQDPATAYRMVGTPSHEAAADRVAGWMQDAGLEVRRFEHACTVNALPDPTGLGLLPNAGAQRNVSAASLLGLLEGRSRTDWVVVGGHYDTREDSVGALDNAAGTSMVVELAKAFAAHREALDASVLFVAWDCEEWGVWGSREFMARLPDVEALFELQPGALRLRMAVALDMPGLSWPADNVWPTYHKGAYSVMHVRTSPIDTFGYQAAYGHYNRSAYTEAQLAGFRAYREVVKHAAYGLLEYPDRWVWVEDDAHGRSDHVPFIAAGVPGMRVHGPSDEEYPPYHKPLDTLPVLDESAGGRERLEEGLAAAARLTAVTAALVALQPAAPLSPSTLPPAATPGLAEAGALAALALVALASRRRP